MKETMRAAFLPGNSTVEMRTVPVLKPGHGEVLIAVKASTICGFGIRSIYREHLGKGHEGYQGGITGQKPSGQIFEVGPSCRRFKAGDRAATPDTNTLVYRPAREG
jgi:NADPH:quinone reductase-like Zn-dependent oxidoreductase